MSDRDPNLLAWQWRLYSGNHVDRRNLVVHVFTVPLFLAGTVALFAAPLSGHPFGALGGLVLMVFAVAAQGRGHKLESVPPEPFKGPGDVVARIFVEQWVTFPRFALSGGLSRAWRGADQSRSGAPSGK
jgi:hypothetical protein